MFYQWILLWDNIQNLFNMKNIWWKKKQAMALYYKEI